MALQSTIILRGFGTTPKLVLRGFSPGPPSVSQPDVRVTFRGGGRQLTLTGGGRQTTTGTGGGRG